MSVRRNVILFAIVAALLAILAAACGQPQVIEKEVVVTKEVVVEKEVVVTKEVEKEVMVEPEIITLRTNWIFNGIHSFLFYGKKMGYFMDEGIILDIREGNGSGNVLRTVVNKMDDFAIVSAEPVIVAESQGAPIKLIMTWGGASSYGYVCNPDSGVKTPEDLYGKTIITSPGAASITIHPFFIEKAGLDPDKMEDLTLVDPGAAVSTVLSGRADCELSGYSDQVPLYQAEGVEPDVIKLKDYGVGGASGGVIVNQDTIDNDPELVSAMLRALRKSMDGCMADQEACVQAMLDDHPMMEFEPSLGQLKYDSELWQSINMGCYGEMVEEDWQGLYDMLKLDPESGLEGDQPITAYYDDSFVPPCE
jgi:NitT/TauT family transport system substrate-binding protein